MRQKNYIEAAMCKRIIAHLSELCIDNARVTVLTPYTDQVNLLKSHLGKYAVKINTFEKA